MEREVIKKLLREFDGEWEWTEENHTEVPLTDIESWVNETKYKITPLIQKIDEFYKTAPQMNWSNNDDYNDQNKMVALSVKGIGDELRNIYASLESIEGEMDYIKNPEKYNED
jgi:hypothetical protein